MLNYDDAMACITQVLLYNAVIIVELHFAVLLYSIMLGHTGVGE